MAITTTGIVNQAVKPLKWIVSSKPYEKVKDKISNKTINDIVAYATIGSIVAKDGIGCLMYVEQSKHNKKIPEERRDFVWKLDAVNGGLMIAFQILFFLGMRKFNDKLFDKFFPSLRKTKLKDIAELLRVDKKKAGAVPEPKSEINEKIKLAKGGALEVFRTITELVASTIIAKRVVVPLIATYITDKLESKHGKKNDKNKAPQPAEPAQPAQNPSQTGAKIDIVNNEDNSNTNLIDRLKNNIK